MFTKRSFALWLVTISLGVCTTALRSDLYPAVEKTSK